MQQVDSSNNCLPWAGQNDEPAMSFPDNSLLEAGSNCRNPTSDLHPWCFTSNSSSLREYCTKIPSCSKFNFVIVKVQLKNKFHL